MKGPLYVTDPAAIVRKNGGRIEVLVNGERRSSAPLMLVTELVLLGPANVSTQALVALLNAGCPIVFLRRDGRLRGRLEPPCSNTAVTRRRQLARSAQLDDRLAIARALVAGKLANQRTALLRFARSPGIAPTIRTDVLLSVHVVEAQAELVPAAATLNTVVGHEGAAAAAYYRAIRLLAGTPGGFARRQRSAGDIVNTALNYTSALLRETVLGAIGVAGLDPELSFLHEPSRGRPTLAFDLMEEWRPILVDGVVLSALGLSMLSVSNLQLEPGDARSLLDTDGRRALIERFTTRLAGTASERDRSPASAARTYRDALYHQVDAFRLWIDGRRPTYEPFRWK